MKVQSLETTGIRQGNRIFFCCQKSGLNIYMRFSHWATDQQGEDIPLLTCCQECFSWNLNIYIYISFSCFWQNTLYRCFWELLYDNINLKGIRYTYTVIPCSQRRKTKNHVKRMWVSFHSMRASHCRDWTQYRLSWDSEHMHGTVTQEQTHSLSTAIYGHFAHNYSLHLHLRNWCPYLLMRASQLAQW